MACKSARGLAQSKTWRRVGWYIGKTRAARNDQESPFFGPASNDVLVPGMTVCVDVSFFGHPEFHGARIETGYEITAKGPVPMSSKMDRICTGG